MYKATRHLSTNNVEINVKVHFVIYSIDTSLEVPYLKVYLVKDCEEPPEDLVAHGQDRLGELANLDTFLREHEYLTFPSIDYDASQHFLFTLYCHGVVESLFQEDRYIVAIACDSPQSFGAQALLPVFHLSDVSGLTQWLMDHAATFEYDPNRYS